MFCYYIVCILELNKQIVVNICDNKIHRQVAVS